MNHYLELDTPALLVDKTIMEENIARMADKAQKWGIKLRPHTKTHRTPALAKRQAAAGASGITVAKIGEAEVMAANGLDDIFIANEVFGQAKNRRLQAVNEQVRLAVGVDNQEQIEALAGTFNGAKKPLELMIEVETGEERTGVLTPEEALRLAKLILQSPGLRLRGIFTHEGHTYGASTQRNLCSTVPKKSGRDTCCRCLSPGSRRRGKRSEHRRHSVGHAW
jgi:D-serine deaminase-like pyridoxal phosphate-dependent protein